MKANEFDAQEPSWWPATPPWSGVRRDKHRLADQARRLLVAIQGIAPDDSDPALINDLAGGVGALTHEAERLPRVRRPRRDFIASPDDTSLFERSPVSGRGNPLAPPMRAWTQDGTVHAEARYSEAYEGPPGGVHGGIVMAAFDEVLGLAQHASGLSGFTGTLTVRMLALTPLHVPIEYQAHIVEVGRRRITVSGHAQCEDVVLGEAEGVFVVPREWR